jgi:hypothetical protein
MRDIVVTLEEGNRQMTILALAVLSIERPGWLDALERIALLMDNQVDGKPQMFHTLRGFNLSSELGVTRPALMAALNELVKLSSHYAELLNAYDDGKRMQFANANAWIARLIKIGKISEER